MAGSYGVVSWFCCGNAWGPCGTVGHGTCRTCRTCNSGGSGCSLCSGCFQHAWPYASDACFAITRPDSGGETLNRRTGKVDLSTVCP